MSDADEKQALRDIVAEERLIDRKAGKLSAALAIGGFIGTAVLLVGGWIWWGSAQAELLKSTKDRVDKIEVRIEPLRDEAIIREQRVRALEEGRAQTNEKLEKVSSDISEIKGDLKVLLRRVPR